MPTLRIKLGNRLVGTITNVVTDKNIFVFDPGYVEDERRPVLSLSYYDIERKLVTRPREVQRRLPPFFSNLLPERDGVLRDYLAQRGGISPEREFPLLWLVGADMPGAVIAVRPIGVFLMQDEAGVDEKIVAVPVSRLTRRYDQVREYTDLPEIAVKQIEHFFAHYKDLEPGKWVKVEGWGSPEEARREIAAGVKVFKAK